MHYAPMPEFKDKDVRRFWSYVDQRLPDECWNWTRSTFNDGYGQFKCARRNRKTHRIAYFLHNGVDPLSLLVCHTCDNPRCCNPTHLFLGTELDNSLDAQAKGRLKAGVGERHGSVTHPEKWYKGENANGAKLTADDVRQIRRTYAAGQVTLFELAARYGVKRETVGRIIQGKNWKQIAEEDGLGSLSDRSRFGSKGERNGSAKLTADDVIAIRASYAQGGFKYSDLAIRYRVTKEMIGHIIRRLAWRHIP